MKDTATYLVAWTGGYETPSFVAFANEADATEQFNEWRDEIDSLNGDQIDLLLVDQEMGAIVLRTAYINAETNEVVETVR